MKHENEVPEPSKTFEMPLPGFQIKTGEQQLFDRIEALEKRVAELEKDRQKTSERFATIKKVFEAIDIRINPGAQIRKLYNKLIE